MTWEASLLAVLMCWLVDWVISALLKSAKCFRAFSEMRLLLHPLSTSAYCHDGSACVVACSPTLRCAKL